MTQLPHPLVPFKLNSGASGPARIKQSVEEGVSVPFKPEIITGTLAGIVSFGKIVRVMVLFAPQIGVDCAIHACN
jgi:hypothetical protein